MSFWRTCNGLKYINFGQPVHMLCAQMCSLRYLESKCVFEVLRAAPLLFHTPTPPPLRRRIAFYIRRRDHSELKNGSTRHKVYMSSLKEAAAAGKIARVSSDLLQDAFLKELDASEKAGNEVYGPGAQLWSTFAENVKADVSHPWGFLNNGHVSALFSHVGAFTFPTGPRSRLEGYPQLLQRFYGAVDFMRGVWQQETGSAPYF